MSFKMNRHVLLILVMLGAHDCRAQGEIHFREGVAAYNAEQYEAAVQAFKASLAKQPAAGTLLNLGLAEWHRDRVGAAVLHWEQAVWLDPFNGPARDNLVYARDATQVSPPDLSWCEQASTWLPASFWAWIAGGSLWLAVALMTLPGFFRIRKAAWHQSLATAALVVFLLSIPPSIGIFTRSKVGIVLEKSTTLRLTPTQAAESVVTLVPGEPVRRLRSRGDYVYVCTQSGDGWVERQQIGFICPQ